jgi:hypothetical protein
MTARKMINIDSEIDELRKIVRQLKPTGDDGFEGLLAAVLTEVLGIIFVLAKSGSQRGRDGDSSLSNQAIKFEAKLYKDSVPKEEVLSKLAEISADEYGQTDLWILGSTGPVAAQDVQTAKNFGLRSGISIIIVDWSSAGLPGLATLLALAADRAAKFLSEKLGQDQSSVRSKIAAVRAHPQFVDRSLELNHALSEPSLAPAHARNANKDWLHRAFQSTERARQVFGQPMAPGDAATGRILDRAAIRESYAKSLFAAPNGAIATLLGFDGSGKSWLFAQTWLAQADPILTLVLVPSDFTVVSNEGLEDLLLLKCIVQTGETPTEAAKARWRRYFTRWRRLVMPARPMLLVFVDGINERTDLSWGRILDTLNGLLGDLRGRLAISCRTVFFRDHVQPRLASAVDATNVPEWSEAELGQLLSARGIATGKLSRAVADSLKNPRIFAVACQLLDTRKIEQIEELSVNRLLFEHLQSSDPGVTVTPQEFVRHVREHANVILSRLRQQDVDDLTIFDAWEARATGTTVDASAEFLLRCADLRQQRHRIERVILLPQPLLYGFADHRMCQSSLIGRQRVMIAFDHLGALAPLVLQLERWLEEVHVEPRRRVEPANHASRLNAVKPAISRQSSDNCAVLLLDESLIVLFVGSRSCHLELLLATPGNDQLIHESAVVVEVDTAQKPME